MNCENQMHDQLHTMLYLLTKSYPTNKEFDAVFKENMFVKNNKSGFHQVIHYLLNILNPDLVKEKIRTWPLYDIKLEAKFRGEVFEVLRQLPTIYPDADIPSIMASQLISPGGFKFVKFLLKLTQLVLFEHLQKRENAKKELLNPIKPHKNPAVTSIIVKTLRQRICNIKTETVNLAKEFDESFKVMEQKASVLVNRQEKVNNELKELSQKASDCKEIEVQENVSVRISNLEEKINSFQTIKDLCAECDQLLTFLTNDHLILQSDKPDEFKDLAQFFKAFKFHLEKENLQLPNFTENQLKEMISRIADVNKKYSHLNEKLCENENRLAETVNHDIF